MSKGWKAQAGNTVVRIGVLAGLAATLTGAGLLGARMAPMERLSTGVRPLALADYAVDRRVLAPLSAGILKDVANDLATAPQSQDVTGPSASPTATATPSSGGHPSPSASPSPLPTGILPSLPIPTPSLPVSPAPTLPIPTPSLPVPTPSLPVPTPSLPAPTPSLPAPSLPVPTPSLPGVP